MKKILAGLIAGIIISLTLVFMGMPGMMLKERVSPLEFDQTVDTIEKAVEAGGWVISQKMDMQKSLKKHGKEVSEVVLFKICEPHYAATIINDDDAKIASVMMPCTISVYKKSDGKTYVGTMNAGLMGRMFGGTISKVMAGSVAGEVSKFTAFLDQAQ